MKKSTMLRNKNTECTDWEEKTTQIWHRANTCVQAHTEVKRKPDAKWNKGSKGLLVKLHQVCFQWVQMSLMPSALSTDWVSGHPNIESKWKQQEQKPSEDLVLGSHVPALACNITWQVQPYGFGTNSQGLKKAVYMAYFFCD